MVRVFLYPPFSYIINQEEVMVPWQEGMTFAGLLRELTGRFPALSGQLFTGDGQAGAMIIASGVIVKPTALVQPDQEVTLVTPVAGG
ncbi:MAG: MoaD/ThiS family protein [Firmicutes bacterium]|nr:MoaD/ThiS family protein [Bacillota bacterium]